MTLYMLYHIDVNLQQPQQYEDWQMSALFERVIRLLLTKKIPSSFHVQIWPSTFGICKYIPGTHTSSTCVFHIESKIQYLLNFEKKTIYSLDRVKKFNAVKAAQNRQGMPCYPR